jgi:hypothetical protein
MSTPQPAPDISTSCCQATRPNNGDIGTRVRYAMHGQEARSINTMNALPSGDALPVQYPLTQTQEPWVTTTTLSKEDKATFPPMPQAAQGGSGQSQTHPNSNERQRGNKDKDKEQEDSSNKETEDDAVKQSKASAKKELCKESRGPYGNPKPERLWKSQHPKPTEQMVPYKPNHAK